MNIIPNRLELNNFGTYFNVGMDLKEPVHIITGRNGEGKSTLRDALEYLFTGKARGLTKKNQCGYLAGKSGERFVTKLCTVDNEIVRTQTNQSGYKFPWSEELLGVMCDHLRLARMTHEDRQRLFQQVLSSETGTTIGKALEDSGVSVSGLDLLDLPASAIDQAEKQAVDGRRAAKRAMEAVREEVVNLPPAEVTVNEKTVDVTKGDVAPLQKKLDELVAERARLMTGAELLDADAVMADQAAAEKALADGKESLRDVGPRIGEARRELAKAKALVSSLYTQVVTTASKSGALRQQVSGFMKLSGGCVLSSDAHPIACSMTAASRKTVLQDLEAELATAVKEADETKGTHESAVAAVDSIQADISAMEKESSGFTAAVSQAEANLARLAKDVADLKALPEQQEKAAVLDARIENGRLLMDAIRAYATAKDEQERVAVRIEGLAKEIALFDSIATALAEGGTVRTALAGSVNEVSVDAALQSAWNCVVSAKPDGEILFTNSQGVTRPVEMASFSEQWKACMLVADLLMRKAGTKMLILDQMDSLEKETRKPLNGWAARWKENGYEKILLIAAADQKPVFPSPAPDWIGNHWVMSGKVERI